MAERIIGADSGRRSWTERRQALTGGFRRRGGPVLEGGPPGGVEGPEPAPVRRSWRRTAVKLLVLLAAFVGMVAFAVALARITLVPVPGAVGQVHSNLRPGDSLRHYFLHATTLDAARQVGGNVLLGVPFGVLLPVLWPRARGLFRVLIRTAAVMLLVELVQGALITGRAFDIDDVILNTTGALLGYLLLGRRLARTVTRRSTAPVGGSKSTEGTRSWHRMERLPEPIPAKRKP